MPATATNGARVRVYWNVHRRCWSVVSLERAAYGRVIAHTERLALRDARPHVSETGRQRVVRTGRKEIHAWITGRVIDAATPPPAAQVRYNPFTMEAFAVDGVPVRGAFPGPVYFGPNRDVRTVPVR